MGGPTGQGQGERGTSEERGGRQRQDRSQGDSTPDTRIHSRRAESVSWGVVDVGRQSARKEVHQIATPDDDLCVGPRQSPPCFFFFAKHSLPRRMRRSCRPKTMSPRQLDSLSSHNWYGMSREDNNSGPAQTKPHQKSALPKNSSVSHHPSSFIMCGMVSCFKRFSAIST